MKKKVKIVPAIDKVLLVKMGYTYLFLLLFFPLMSLIWDCTQSHNFKTFLYESWKRCFFFRTAKIFMFTTLFSQFDLQFDPKPFMLPKLRVVATWKYFFLVHTSAGKLNFHEKKSKNIRYFLFAFYTFIP